MEMYSIGEIGDAEDSGDNVIWQSALCQYRILNCNGFDVDVNEKRLILLITLTRFGFVGSNCRSLKSTWSEVDVGLIEVSELARIGKHPRVSERHG